jgi:hypothetical protein
MTTIPPFHVVSPAYSTRHRHVYHDCDECHEARSIKQEDRVPGTGGKQHCRECMNICSSM